MLTINRALASPNFNERDTSVPLQFIIIHYTGMPTGAAALQRLCDPSAEVSAHYLIEQNGEIFQLVDETKRAWHAGKSFWRGVRDINSASIGIELVNKGHEFGYEPFPSVQITALIELCHDIQQRHNLPASAVLGHSDIAPQRKEDPGEYFPWPVLAQQNIGVWPDFVPQDNRIGTIAEAQHLLQQIGYDCPSSGAIDAETRKALIAFQRHYAPQDLSGELSPQVWQMLRGLCHYYGSRVVG